MMTLRTVMISMGSFIVHLAMTAWVMVLVWCCWWLVVMAVVAVLSACCMFDVRVAVPNVVMMGPVAL